MTKRTSNPFVLLAQMQRQLESIAINMRSENPADVACVTKHMLITARALDRWASKRVLSAALPAYLARVGEQS